MPIGTEEEAKEWLSGQNILNEVTIDGRPLQTIHNTISKYLDQISPQNFELHGILFNYLSPNWNYYLSNMQFSCAEIYWATILKIVENWETEHNSRIHKGAAYYYWGGTAILAGNINRGFLLIHKAVEEDRITYNQYPAPDTPAYKTITLRNDNKQTWFSLVTLWREYLEQLYNQYPRYTEFAFQQFENRFFAKDNIDETFFFTFTLARLHNDSQLANSIQIESEFASQYRLNLLFDLALVIDSYITKKDQSLLGKTFYHKIPKLLSALPQPNPQVNIGEVLGNLNSRANASTTAFASEIAKLLNEKNTAESPFPGPYADAAITYCVRNFSGHKISGPTIISNRFNEILQSVLNTLFLAVELL